MRTLTPIEKDILAHACKDILKGVASGAAIFAGLLGLLWLFLLNVPSC